MVNMMCVWLFSTSTALLWLMSWKLTPLAARIWSPILMPFCSARPPGSSLKCSTDSDLLTKIINSGQMLKEVPTWKHRCPDQTPFLHVCWSRGSNHLRLYTGERSFEEQFLNWRLKESVRSPPQPYVFVPSPPLKNTTQLWIFVTYCIIHQ